MIGPVTRAELDAQKYEWMAEGHAATKADLASKTKAIETLKKNLKDVDVEIYFGSWCGDSHDHLPTFLALTDALKPNAPKSLALFARDRKNGYGDFKIARSIERLPTFVFLKNGKEIGRIVETPTKSILEDTLAISSKPAGK